MNFRFDHIYSADKNFKFRKKLGQAGFYLDERVVEHPGKSFCRLIMLPLVNNKKQYLEFIHMIVMIVTDHHHINAWKIFHGNAWLPGPLWAHPLKRTCAV